jgi:hypothetical protein
MLSITDLQFVSFRISSHETEYLNGIDPVIDSRAPSGSSYVRHISGFSADRYSEGLNGYLRNYQDEKNTR